MNFSDPQILYMVLILPSLFGLTLIGEGLNKVMKSQMAGFISIVFGLLFLGAVIFAYFLVSGNFAL